jgi:phosphoribosylformylglycinamidine synthase II
MNTPDTEVEIFPVLNVSDEEVTALAAHHGLGLTLEDLREIAGKLGRDLTIVEVHAFDAQWSEHCSYKSSRALLRQLPTEGLTVIQGPGEDAGILRLGVWNEETYGIVIAHESHNHPSQLVPYEGAATGIGGIVRDVLCMGAEVIAVADPLRFGRTDRGDAKSEHAKYVAQNAVRGIGGYGNAIGVPNIAGDVYFDEGFDENCLVNVVSLGLVKESQIIRSHAPPGGVGFDVVLVGKATDRSGFGGAAFSSVGLNGDDSEAKRAAVQVPDPFLKNVIMRASYKVFELLRKEKAPAGFKDLGAGGIVGCSAEMAHAGNMGMEIDLDQVSVAQQGLPPAVIAIGETQERLIWIVPRAMTARVMQIYNEEFSLPMIAQGAGALVIGRVTEPRDYVLRSQGREVMRIPLPLLCGELRRHRPIGWVSHTAEDNDLPHFVDGAILPQVLAHRDVCSRRPLIERYDSVVRGTTAIPAGYADAGVICPIPGAPLGVALSVDGNPRYGKIDAKRAAELAVCESHRNVAAVGARPIGLTDCLNYGNPERGEHYAQLVSGVEGLADAARALGTPFVSGNVSLYNESSSGEAVPASAIVACVGSLDDVSRSVTSRFAAVGSAIYLIGDRQSNLAGSVFADLQNFNAFALPTIAYPKLKRELEMVVSAITSGSVLAAHDISDGGLLAALAEMTFAYYAPGEIGARIAIEELAKTIGTAGYLYGEAGGFLLEVPAEREKNLVALAGEFDLEVVRLGETIAEPQVHVDGVSFSIAELFAAWDAPLTEVYP